MRNRHAAYQSDCLCSFQGKGLGRDLNQVNILHYHVRYPSIVVEKVIDLRHTARGVCIALGEIGQVAQCHDLEVGERLRVGLDKVLAEWGAAFVVAVVLILALVLCWAQARTAMASIGSHLGR